MVDLRAFIDLDTRQLTDADSALGAIWGRMQRESLPTSGDGYARSAVPAQPLDRHARCRRARCRPFSG